VAVFKFSALAMGKENEDHYEKGTVVAHDQREALDKLRRERYTQIRLKQLRGVSALFRQFTADIR
jgi:type II secretory pathway component PulF